MGVMRLARAKKLLAMAERATQDGDWPAAHQRSAEALQLCQAEHWDTGIARAYQLLIRSCQLLARFPEADRYAKAAAEWARSRGDAFGFAHAVAQRGETATLAGDHLRASEFLHEALDVLATLSDDEDIATLRWAASSMLGSALYHLGRLAEAEQAQRLAYELARSRGTVTQAGLAASQLALVTVQQGLRERALEYAHEARNHAPAASGPIAAELLGNLAVALTALGRHGEAKKAIEQALRLAETSELLLRQALIIASEVAEGSGDWSDALALIDRQLGRLPADDRRGHADLLNRRAAIRLRQGAAGRALPDLDRSVELRRELADRDPRVLAVGLSMRARARLEIGDPPAAERDADEAAALWAPILDAAGAGSDDAVASGLFEKHALLIYQTQLEILLATGRAEQAVEASESSRGGPFTRLVRAALPARQAVPAHPPDLTRMTTLAGRLDATIVLFGTLYGLEPGQAGPPRIQAVHAWVISPRGTVTHRQLPFSTNGTDEPPSPQATDIATAIAGLGDELSQPAVLRKAGESLIDPIADLLPIAPGSRLIILPQRLLWAIPFTALTLPDGSALLDRYEIGLAPSVHALELLAADGNPREPGAALVVGGVHGARRPLVTGGFAELDDLVNSAEEARRVARHYTVTPLLGAAANVPAVCDALRTASVVHIASHAIQDAAPRLDRPPGIVALTPTGGDQGQLTSEMVQATTPIAARLVVLSSCASSHGMITQDGVRGMVRSFLAAGATTVIASLWPVADYAAVLLMERFHAELTNGRRPAAALRSAALTIREDYDDPRIWAAFQSYGLP